MVTPRTRSRPSVLAPPSGRQGSAREVPGAAPGVPRGEVSGDGAAATGLPFVLEGAERVIARGLSPVLAAAGVDPFASGDGSSDRAPVVVGLLPFAVDEEPLLFRPRSWLRARGGRSTPAKPLATASGAGGSAPRVVSVVPRPPAGDYRAAVVQALRRINDPSDPLRKVVLARRLEVHGSAPFDPMEIRRRLAADPEVTTFLVPLDDGGALVGATPELLVERSGRSVTSFPLAGSARRGADAGADAEAARHLRGSTKDLGEHELVVERILDTLAPHCRVLARTGPPVLARTGSLWHLGTRIRGELVADAPPALELARLLHPTPAVCGVPTPAAAAAIRELEPFPRGWYAGAVGWCDSAGDGRWMVSIRCAELRGGTATLHAGAGIVEGSDPDTEVDETDAKFQAMLQALGVGPEGVPAAATGVSGRTAR